MVILGIPPKLENGAMMSQPEFHALYEQCEELRHVELIEGVVYMDTTFHRGLPPGLENGAVMTQPEFHALYEQAEGLSRVELIEGVVFMPSPVKLEGHAREQSAMWSWLQTYADLWPGEVEASGPVTLILDAGNEPEPDALMFRVSPDRLENGYIKGAPELLVEISNTSASRDLHWKKDVYERNGVLEYIVWQTQEKVINWFQLRDGVFIQREPDPDGMIESEVFPGLRLDVPAMLAGDRAKVRAAVVRR